MTNNSNEFKAILRKKTGFFNMWRNVICEFQNGVLKVHQGLSETLIERIIKITPDVRIKFVPDENHNKFSIEEEGKDELLLAAENTSDALNWIQALRGETYRSDELSMDNFDIISLIGKGYYGKVILASKKDTRELFAIKVVKKSYLAECGKTQTIMMERNILFKANSPFIVKIKFAFQTAAKFYIGMEYVPGGELFHLLEKEDTFTIKDTRFYIAEIALALDYLHSIGVVYRDLKLENVLIGNDGHIKLCDFGLSKDITPNCRTNTFCGTTEYLAPEIILGQEYDYKIDWWALGILTYELLFGETPFYDQTNKGIMDAIVHDDPPFADNAPKQIVDFIKKLLTKDPKNRPTLEDLKDHPFWNKLNWDDVLNKKLKPPFVPKDLDKNPIANFDSEFTNEPITDSLATPVMDSHGEFSGFTLDEETTPHEEPSTTAASTPPPSSILTLDLISPL